MLNDAVRSFFIALASTAMAVMVTAMATSATPAFAQPTFSPDPFVSVV
jgi:hypothetical protein